MRYLVMLLFLLAGCETFDLGKTFGWGEKSAAKNKYSYCNVPQRFMIFRTSPELCRELGGHRVDDGKADELDAHYQSLTAS